MQITLLTRWDEADDFDDTFDDVPSSPKKDERPEQRPEYIPVPQVQEVPYVES